MRENRLQTASSDPTTTLSTTAATPGERSRASLEKSFPSATGNGHMSFNQGELYHAAENASDWDAGAKLVKDLIATFDTQC
jgi:hypothetical protein